MRKPRIIIYDDNNTLLLLFKDFFTMRGYDVLAYQTPQACPIYKEDGACENRRPCADIVLSDYRMLDMIGTEMLRAQSRGGCKVPVENRALMSGDLDERGELAVRELGCAFFQKPFSFTNLSAWLDGREQCMDLSQPLGTPRREQRLAGKEEITLLTTGERAFNGITVNRSPSGLCLKTAVHLPQGEALTVRPGLSRPSRRASVRWVRDSGDGFYLTGLQYEANLETA
jgi:CheY-like chemotaxis protein